VDTNNDGTISFEEWRYVLSQFDHHTSTCASESGP
jgi:Ca2+-binding EF-hand superfamily protein